MPLPPLVTIAHRTGIVMLAPEHIKLALLMAVNAHRTNRPLQQALSEGGMPSDLTSALEKENVDDENRWLFEHIDALAEGRERPGFRPPAAFEKFVDEAWTVSGRS